MSLRTGRVGAAAIKGMKPGSVQVMCAAGLFFGFTRADCRSTGTLFFVYTVGK